MNKKIIVNITDALHIIRADKRQMAIWLAVAAVLGIVVALTTPKTYQSTVMLAPEESGAGFSGSISSLASMVGMNMKLGQTGDALYPEIYPDLVSSIDFTIGLFPVQVATKDGSVHTDYYTYLTRHERTALTDYPRNALAAVMRAMRPKEPTPAKGRNDAAAGPIWLTRDQAEVAKAVTSLINCAVDKKTNVITLTAQAQDPLVAATMADSVRQHLQVAITDYRTKKARTDLLYMQQLFAAAKADYDKSRQAYAAYADANQDVNLQAYKLKEEDMENDMQLKYNIYQQVVEQLQLAKAKVQERTPAFTVMQSAAVPTKPNSRGRAATVLIWIALGFVARTAVLAWKNRQMFLQ